MNIKIAPATDDGQTISQHFGRAKYYTALTIEDSKIIACEQREQVGHTHFAGEEQVEEKDPRGHGFAPAEQNHHFRMADAIRDCKFLLARGMGAGAYYGMEQVGIKPVVTDIASIDEAAQGIIVDHKEKLH